MWKILSAGSILIAASVGGCVTKNDASVAVVDDVQQAGKAICRFVPTVGTIISILELGIPGLTTAQAIAVKICELIPKDPPKAGERRAPVVFQNVTIQGSYIVR